MGGWENSTRGAPEVELVPGQPFDRGDGTLVSSSGSVFEFLDFVIPRGVTVRVRSPGNAPLQIRSCGAMRIDGTLVLDATPPSAALSQAQMGRRVTPAHDLVNAAGVVLFSAGDIDVRGHIEHLPLESRSRGGSPLTLISGGDVRMLGGRVPSETTVGTESGRILGEAQGAFGVPLMPMDRGLPAGVALRAEAWCEWFALPHTRYRRVEIELDRPSDGLRVQVQVTRGDSSNPARPSRDGQQSRVPLPLTGTARGSPGRFPAILSRSRSASRPTAAGVARLHRDRQLISRRRCRGVALETRPAAG